MDLQFTAVFRQVPEGYIGFVEELPGANTQGATLEEARENLAEAVRMVLDANRELAKESLAGGTAIREASRSDPPPGRPRLRGASGGCQAQPLREPDHAEVVRRTATSRDQRSA